MAWVQDYIYAFGGDPDRVTLFGTSSGAGSVLLQTLAYGGAPTSLFAVGIASAPYEPEVFEVQAVWGPEYAVNHAVAPGANGYENVNAALVPVVQGYWTSFARVEDPNVYRQSGSSEWG